MPGVPAQTVALVLGRQPSGSDKFEQLSLFSPEMGTLFALRRLTQKNPAPAIDLFDEADFWLESSNQGRTWFVKEHRLILRSAALGRSYDALRCAAAVAALVLRNPVPDDSRASIAALLRQALASLADGARPELVWLKTLFCFLRDEGLPVKQQWWTQLPAADRDLAARLLNQPLATLAVPAGDVARIVRQLEDWIQGHTEVHLR